MLISKLPEANFSLPNLKTILQSSFSVASPSAKISENFPKPSASATVRPSTRPTSSATPTPKPSLAPKPIATPKVSPPRECYRYVVTHLDGSTSNRCYLQTDYNQLVDLGYQLSSAKSFYQFFLDGVSRYQQEYEKTGSSIYLDAKASQQAKADSEKVKIDQLNVKMYNLESRGY